MILQENNSLLNEFDKAALNWDESLYRHERARVVAQGIQNHVPLTPHMAAMEYGCGTGLLSFALQPYLGQIILADSSGGMLAAAQEKIAACDFCNMTPLQLDLITDPLPLVRVQLIYTLMTLHHISDTCKILRAFYALLDGPGYVCIADLDQEDGSFHGPDFTGHKGFQRDALAGIAREVGFQNIQFSTVFQTPRPVGGQIIHFPVFLMVAEKRSA